jgi:hypothetical protein
MWDLLALLFTWPLPGRKTRKDVDRAFGEPLERLRWVIYAVVAAGLLILVVALAAVWIYG